ncbi:hypothetical protein [Streptomyces sp. NPDC048473]|uniref:hypothetical protein n=1 Tax=unclassified Streptomyces TaxID=2593676 RepID=UPI00371CA4F9
MHPRHAEPATPVSSLTGNLPVAVEWSRTFDLLPSASQLARLHTRTLLTMFKWAGNVEGATTVVGILVDNARVHADPGPTAEDRQVRLRQCPHLQRGYNALMVRSAPLYGVIGTAYEWTAQGIKALAGDDVPVPYRDPTLKWFLASQLVRTLTDFTVVDLDDLTTLDSIA